MGFVDSIFGKKDVDSELKSGVPFRIKLAFSPVRITAKRNNSVELLVDLENVTKETLLASLVIHSQSGVGLDSIGLNKEREVRIGQMKEGETKTIRVTVYGSTNTAPGEYRIDAIAMAHYRDYGHVLNAVRKSADLRAV